MKKVSTKQAKKNREIARIKKGLPALCEICNSKPMVHACHLLPRSVYPEYYTEPKNIFGGCCECHNLFDNNIEFRQRQEHLKRRAISFAKLTDVIRYFKL